MGPMIPILLTAFVALAGQITFPTGLPELMKSGGVAFPMPEKEYATFSEQVKNNPQFVAIKKKPAGLAPRYPRPLALWRREIEQLSHTFGEPAFFDGYLFPCAQAYRF